MHKTPQGEVVETAREARAGYLDRPVLVVLVIAVALAFVALGAVWLSL